MQAALSISNQDGILSTTLGTLSNGKGGGLITYSSIGKITSFLGTNDNSGGILNSHVGSTATSWGYETTGLIWNNNNGTGSNATLTTGDILGIAYDADAGVISYYKNNSLI